MPHDQLWKELLWTFFQEFMELFFPDVARRLDFASVRLLEKELFTDVPEGVRREPDLLVEAHTASGEIELILVHVEVQAKREKDVPYRMWEYYSLLRLRRKLPVFPVVVYLAPGTGGVVQETYSEGLFGRVLLDFRYTAVGLPDLPAEEYIDSGNVLAHALSALMRSSERNRVTRRLRAYRRLVTGSMDEARQSLLINVVDQYITLAAEEEAELRRMVEQTDAKEVRELITQWEERALRQGIEQGIERGIEQGIEQGLVQGQRRSLLLVMRRRFGELPAAVVNTIEGIPDSRILDELLERVSVAETLEELGLG